MSNFSVKSRSTRKSLGSLSAIQTRSKRCPFCSLVIQSILPVDGLRSYDSARCSVNWELDGRAFSRDQEGRPNGRTRRIHLVWDDESLKDSYLVFVAPETYLRPNSDARRVWGDEALFLGRTIDTETGNQALVKSWLELCRNTHRGPCRDDTTLESSVDFGEIISQSYFGVIDVLDMQLTSLPFETNAAGPDMAVPDWYDNGEDYAQDYAPDLDFRRREPAYNRRITHAPYIALSYVWGKGKPYTTRLSNIMLHRNHGGLERDLHKLPRVFHDAFNLVRCLGVRYIWIDSLCIVQDSSRSWDLNSRVMDLIYGNAVLTICAADGVDSSTGLRAMHPQEHDADQISADCAQGVRLMVSRPPEIGIRASKWNTRAWTFQERLLSKRCLIFTEGRVYFQCLSTGMSEDIFADREGAGWSLDLVNAPLQMSRELSRRALWVYTNCVPLYTARVLTKPKDILAAFNGICNVMQETMQAPFIFGLPSSHFDMALLWEPQRALERRVPKTDMERAEYGDMQFPSWSWCGWTSDALDLPPENKSEYKASMVNGCLPDVHEWLMKHTWIDWYIRDGHGNLRPLWDRKKAKADKSSEKRWKGYEGLETLHIYDVDRRIRSGERLTGRKARHADSENSDDSDDSDVRYEKYVEVNEESIFDYYGRPIPLVHDFAKRKRHPLVRGFRKERNRFYKTLPENPYRVVMVDYDFELDKGFPDQPILQFWTWHTSLRLMPTENSGSRNPGKGLCRCDIFDEKGDWCGSLVVDEKWITESPPCSKHEFIAISEAKAFTEDECEAWTYYIPKGREESEWDLFYVLLVERKENMRWERVALGKVFKDAFLDADWKEIVLG